MTKGQNSLDQGGQSSSVGGLQGGVQEKHGLGANLGDGGSNQRMSEGLGSSALNQGNTKMQGQSTGIP